MLTLGSGKAEQKLLLTPSQAVTEPQLNSALLVLSMKLIYSVCYSNLLLLAGVVSGSGCAVVVAGGAGVLVPWVPVVGAGGAGVLVPWVPVGAGVLGAPVVGAGAPVVVGGGG